MFIRLFKSNNVVALAVLPFIALCIWCFGFIQPQVLPLKHTMPLYEVVAGLTLSTAWLNTLLAFILVLGQAYLLNYIVNQNDVLPKQSYLPALLYVVFISNNKDMLELHPLLFSNLFVLLAIEKLVSSYRKDIAFSESFDAGILFSIASLFYLPNIVFFPLLGVAFILFRPFNWREWVISFFGVILPYVFLVSYYFWFDKLDYLWYDKLLFQFVREQAIVYVPGTFYTMIAIGWLVIFLSLIKTFGSLSVGSQKSKKSMVFFIWLALFSGASIFIAPEISTKYFSALAIPTSVFCANYFLTQKKEWYGELLFLILIGTLFVNLILRFL